MAEHQAAEHLSQFADKLRKLRKERKLTQAELGQLAGIHNVNLSRYERGTSEPSADALKRLADALGVTVGYLFDDNVYSGFEDLELRRQISEIEQLPEGERNTVKSFLDAFLFRNRVQALSTQSRSQSTTA